MPTLPEMRAALSRLAAALVVAAVALAGAPAAAQAEEIVAIDASIEAGPQATRLVFTTSGPLEARAFAIDGPNRIVVDLPRVNFQLPADAPAAGGLVASLRTGLFSRARSRIVIELAAPARVASLASAPRRDGAHALVLDLVPVDERAFREAVAADAQALRAATLAAPAPSPPVGDGRPTVVIDPGHGGVDPGAAAANGVLEKDLVFGFADRLRRRLEESGRLRVLMTREEDVFVSLSDRVAFARAAPADLFVSIHADSISAAPQVSGLTVYTNAERASDVASAALAERENRADAAGGVERAEASGEVADILRELTLRETRGYSHAFARTLVDKMGAVARLNRNPHRQAGFMVLRAHDVPSVLVELGYLSSERDIAVLTSEAWRDEATAAMAAAIERFFAPRFAGRDAGAAIAP